MGEATCDNLTASGDTCQEKEWCDSPESTGTWAGTGRSRGSEAEAVAGVRGHPASSQVRNLPGPLDGNRAVPSPPPDNLAPRQLAARGVRTTPNREGE